jgi:hypothetical protein
MEEICSEDDEPSVSMTRNVSSIHVTFSAYTGHYTSDLVGHMY